MEQETAGSNRFAVKSRPAFKEDRHVHYFLERREDRSVKATRVFQDRISLRKHKELENIKLILPLYIRQFFLFSNLLLFLEGIKKKEKK